MDETVSRRIVNRRPLFTAALLFAAGILFADSVPMPLILPLACGGFCLLAASAVSVLLHRPDKKETSSKAKKRIFAAFAYAAVFCLGVSALVNVQSVPLLDVSGGKEFSFTGRVAEEPVKTDYGYTHILSDVSVLQSGKDTGIAGKVRFVSEREYPYGAVIAAASTLKLPAGAVNPGGYDEKLNLNRRGVYYKAYADSAAVLRQSPPDLYGWMLALRRDIKGLVKEIFPADVQGLALGMLLGDTAGLSEETYADYKKAGAAHILAVSGLNVGIIIFVFYRLLKLLRIGKKPRFFATLAFIVFYALLTGFGPSIIRASVMAVFFLAAGFFGQKTDPLIVLSASFMVVLLQNPLELFMPGFALTFAAVFGMITIGDAVSKKLGKWPRFLRELAAANTGATAGTAPVLLGRFYSVSTVSPLGNLAIVPLSTAATVLITAAVPLGAIWRDAAIVLTFPATYIMRFIDIIVQFLAGIPYASVTLGALNVFLMAAMLAWMFFASGYFLVKPKLKKAAALASGLLILTATVFSYIRLPGDLYVAFLDVGQGDSAFVRTPDGVNFLVDAGDEWSGRDIASFLDYKGYALDFAILTHPHSDHMGGIVELIQEGRVKTVYTTQFVRDAQVESLKGVGVELLKKGDELAFGDGFTVRVLHPDVDTPARYPNNTSLVLLMAYKGHSCLMTGDISAVTDKTLLDEIGKADIIKVAHHGDKSATSMELLNKARPDYAVISVGTNTYGHPGPELLERLRRVQARVFRTDRNHAVEFSIGDTVKPRPMYE
jgi:competence protein ComEC